VTADVQNTYRATTEMEAGTRISTTWQI
jgi:hypothetical protein